LTYVVLRFGCLRTTPIAGLIVLNPAVKFKTIEGDALLTDGDLGDRRAYLGVEPVAIHAEVTRGIPVSEETGQYCDIIDSPHRSPRLLQSWFRRSGGPV